MRKLRVGLIMVLVGILTLWVGAASAEKLVLPASVTVIEGEAFYGDQSLDEVVLPEGITTIGEYAFANSSLKRINLPSSISSIADTALDKNKGIIVKATRGTDIYQWAVRNGFIVEGEDESPVKDFTFEYAGYQTCYVSGYTGSDTSIVVPSHDADGRSVVGVKNFAFSYKTFLESVILPETVTRIGEGAFQGCTALSNIYIPQSVTSIDSQAFLYCAKLESIQLPAGLTAIGFSTFSQSGLKEIVIPESVTSISTQAFELCISLEKVTFPDGLKTVGMGAFRNCYKLADIELPNNLEEIGETAFSDCISVSSDMPSSLKKMGRNAFAGVELAMFKLPETLEEMGYQSITGKMTSIVIPDSISSISEGVFISECENLTSITIPDSVRRVDKPVNANNLGSIRIEDCANLQSITLPTELDTPIEFIIKNCPKIKSLTLPRGIEEIYTSAFQDCVGLEEIALPDTLKSIGSYAFYGCTNLKEINIPDSVTQVYQSVFTGCTSLEKVTLSQSMETIGEGMFSGCSALKSINIPAGIKVIENSAFSGSGLTRIDLPRGLEKFDPASLSGTKITRLSIPEGTELAAVNSYGGRGLFLGYCNELLEIDFSYAICSEDYISFRGCNSLESVVMPEGITTIDRNTFENCDSLRSVVMPSTITSLPYRIFADCTTLENIELPSGLEEIPENAFDNCVNLAKVYISDSIKIIGDYAFRGCTGLEEIELRKVEEIGIEAFRGTGLRNVVIPATVRTIGDGAFSGSALLNIQIPTTVNEVGHGIVRGCQNLRGFTIPESWTAFGIEEFKNCSNLEKIDITANITSIGAGAFEGCTTLKELYIPDTVTDLGYIDYSSCTSLKTVRLSDQLTSMPNFYDCESLESINVPAGVSALAPDQYHRPFSGCMNLKSVRLSEGLISIGSFAFENLLYLTEIRVPSTVENIDYKAFSGCENLKTLYFDGDMETVAFGSYLPRGKIVYCTPDGSVWKMVERENQYCTEQDVLIPYVNGKIISGIIQGRIETEVGEPVENAYITLVMKNNPSNTYNTISNCMGEWSATVNIIAEYEINYWHMDYQITGGSLAKAGDILNAVAVLTGNEDSKSSYEMKQGNRIIEDGQSLLVGTSIDFTVSASGAKSVQLVVDGKAYEQYPVIDGEATFSRVFSSAGTREIKFRLLLDGETEYTACTPVKRITLESDGTMERTNIHDIGTWAMDSETRLTITWDAVAHADSYRVYFYHDGCRYYPSNEISTITYTTDTSFTLLEEYPLWASDKWSVEVVASGKGWSSSTGTKAFTVVNTLEKVKILHPINDYLAEVNETIKINVETTEENAEVKLDVQTPDGNPLINNQLIQDGTNYYLKLTKGGKYLIRAEASGSSDSIVINVAPPKVVTFFERGADNYYKYVYELENAQLEFNVKFNFIPDTVTLYRDGKVVPNTSISNEEERNWQFILMDTLGSANQMYTYKVVATYEDEKIASSDILVFSMAPNTKKGTTEYASDDIRYYDYPGQMNVATLAKYSPVTHLEGVYNDYSLVRLNTNNIVFIKTNELTKVCPDLVTALTNLVYSGDGKYYPMGATVRMRMQGITSVRNIKAIISYLGWNENATEYVRESKEYMAIRSDKEDNTWTIEFVPEKIGYYAVVLFPTGDISNMAPLLGGSIYAYKTVDEFKEGVFIDAKEVSIYGNEDLSDQYQIGVVKYNDRLSVIGSNGFGTYLVSLEDGTTGFVSAELRETMNPVEKRAYVITSSSMANVDRTRDVSETAISEMSALFNQFGYVVYPKPNVYFQDLTDILNEIRILADYNDITDIYIFSHGNGAKDEDKHGLIIYSTEDGEDKEVYYSYSALVTGIGNIKGNVTIIIDACKSGQFIDTYKSNKYVEQSRGDEICIITACKSDESSYFANVFAHYPRYTHELYSLYVERKSGDKDNSGTIELDELFADIKTVGVYTYSYNVLLGLTKTPIIEQTPQRWPYAGAGNPTVF